MLPLPDVTKIRIAEKGRVVAKDPGSVWGDQSAHDADHEPAAVPRHLGRVAAAGGRKNSDGQKTEDKQASASCQAYQQAPDGSWTPLPCGEMGAKSPTTQKNATHGTDQRTR